MKVKMNKWMKMAGWLFGTFAVLVISTFVAFKLSQNGTEYIEITNAILAQKLWLALIRYTIYGICAVYFFKIRRVINAKNDNLKERKIVQRMGLMILGFCVFNEILVWI